MEDRRTVGAVTASRRELEIRNEIEALLVRFQDVASPRIVADELWNSIVGPALDELAAQVERQHEINAGWSAYSDRKKAERERHVEEFEDALGLPHAGRGYWYERMIKAAADIRAERDALETSVLAALAEARRWWEGGRTMGEVREGLALEAVEAQLRAALPEAS